MFDTITPASRGEDRRRRDRGSRHKKAYSDEEVAAFVRQRTGKPFSINYLGKLKADKSPPPSIEVAEAIAVFFDMPPAYFFNDELSQRMMDQLAVVDQVADQLAEIKVLLDDLDSNSVLLRTPGHMDPADLPAIVAVLQKLRHHRENPADGDPPADPAS